MILLVLASDCAMQNTAAEGEAMLWLEYQVL
jgi:hypothetical protein